MSINVGVTVSNEDGEVQGGDDEDVNVVEELDKLCRDYVGLGFYTLVALVVAAIALWFVLGLWATIMYTRMTVGGNPSDPVRRGSLAGLIIGWTLFFPAQLVPITFGFLNPPK